MTQKELDVLERVVEEYCALLRSDYATAKRPDPTEGIESVREAKALISKQRQTTERLHRGGKAKE